MEIERNDWDRWKTDPVTRGVFKVLKERQEKLGRALGMGAALMPPDNAIASGRYQEIEDLLTMDYDDIREKEE